MPNYHANDIKECVIKISELFMIYVPLSTCVRDSLGDHYADGLLKFRRASIKCLNNTEYYCKVYRIALCMCHPLKARYVHGSVGLNETPNRAVWGQFPMNQHDPSPTGIAQLDPVLPQKRPISTLSFTRL